MRKLQKIAFTGLLLAAMTPCLTAHAKEPKKGAKGPKTVVLKSGLKIQDLKIGKGAIAVSGKMVKVHYRGTLSNGQMFDQSYGRGPFEFQLGEGQVIKGWDLGVAGMKVGGKRKLTIPPALGYGKSGAGGVIPPNATLTFVVELLGVS